MEPVKRGIECLVYLAAVSSLIRRVEAYIPHFGLANPGHPHVTIRSAVGNNGHMAFALVPSVREVRRVSEAARREALTAAGLLHPHPEGVTAALFTASQPFFLPLDKAQVKYEMLRAHIVDGSTVVAAADTHGYSRAAFYLVLGAFEERGMLGLLDEARGRHGPLKLTPEIVAYLRDADPTASGAQLAELIAKRFGVTLHRRTLERARHK